MIPQLNAARIFVDLCGSLWIFVDICGYLWIFVDICGYRWGYMWTTGRYAWIFVDICGYSIQSYLHAGRPPKGNLRGKGEGSAALIL